MPLLHKIGSILSNLARSLADFLFPKNGKVLNLEAMSVGEIVERLPPSEHMEEEVVAVFDYGHTLTKELVWEMKYKGNKLVADKLGEILYDVICSELEERNVFEKTRSVILVPSPISDKRRFERGWNQAELLAQTVKLRDTEQRFKYLPRQLAKTRHTESQTQTGSRKERLANLHESMKVLNPLSIENQYVVVIDDVTTTGATFKEARRALKEAGAKKIFCVAVAH